MARAAIRQATSSALVPIPKDIPKDATMTTPAAPQTPAAASSAVPVKKGRRKWPWVLAAVLALLVVIGIANSNPATPGGSSPDTQPATQAAPPTTTSTDAADPPAQRAACIARPPATGDILVQQVWPGLPADALELGGGWQWNYTTHSCMNSVDMTIATAPRGKGYCTQVALTSDSPGYNVETKPAGPLKKVIASAGC